MYWITSKKFCRGYKNKNLNPGRKEGISSGGSVYFLIPICFGKVLFFSEHFKRGAHHERKGEGRGSRKL
jgi:hypothetical protein